MKESSDFSGAKERVRHISYKQCEQKQFHRDKEIAEILNRNMSDTYKIAMRRLDKDIKKLSAEDNEILFS